MKDIIINVDSTSHKVNFPNEFLGIGYENLQGNLIFQFDNNFIGGQARLDISIDCESGMIPNLTPYENGYILPIKSSLLTGSNVLMQLVIDETSLTQYSLTTDTEINPNKTYYEKVGNDYIIVENPVVGDISQYYEANTPVFKTDIFQLKVKDSINAQETIPEQYPTWINTLNTLIGTINQKLGLVDTALTEMNNLNINVSDKVDGEVTITFTDKQGNQKEVKINDGRGIVSILKTATSGNIDTYTITYTDNTTSIFEVTNGIDGTDGRGIVSIEKTGTTGLIDTYTITYTDNTTSIFNVANGKGITNIEKISTNLLVDTYRISFNDGTTQDYEVTNGKGIVSIEKTSTEGLTDIYTITYNDETTATFNVVNGKGIVSIEKTSTSGYVDTYTITYNDGTTSTYEVTNGEVSQKQLDEVKAELERYKLIENALPKVSGTGTSITLDNTANAGMTLELNPSELEQDGTPTPSNPQEVHTISGDNTIVVSNKNRFNYDDLASKIQTFTINGNEKSFTINGYGTYKYPISLKGQFKISGSWNATNLNGDVKVVYDDDTNENILSSYTGTSASGTINLTTSKSKNIKAIQFRTFGNNNITINNFMISTNGGDYIPYTSQEADIDLGDIEYCEIGDYKDEFIRTSGKNLLNITDTKGYVFSNGLPTTTSSNITIDNFDSNNITYHSNTSGYLIALTNIIQLEPSTQYTISFSRTTTATNNQFFIYDYANSGYSINYRDNNTNVYSHTFTTNSVGQIVLAFGYGNTKGTTTISNIMINKGSTALPYEPYNNGKWYIKKNIGKYVANNDITGNGQTDYFVSVLTPTLNVLIGIAGAIFKNLSLSNLMSTHNQGASTNYSGLAGTTNDSRIRINLSKEYCSDYATANTFLTNNNFTIYYVLSTPEYILLNDTLQSQLEYIYNLMLSYQGQTNISQINNDLPFIIDSTALKDLTSL